MGYDIYMTVIAECGFFNILQRAKDKEENKIRAFSDKRRKEAMEFFSKTDFDHTIDRMSIVFDDKGDLEMQDWDMPLADEDNATDEDDKDYSDFFMHYLLTLLETKPIEEWKQIFQDEYGSPLKIKKGSDSTYTVEFVIASESSYKGGEKLDINFGAIQENIYAFKKTHPDADVYTKLGMC